MACGMCSPPRKTEKQKIKYYIFIVYQDRKINTKRQELRVESCAGETDRNCRRHACAKCTYVVEELCIHMEYGLGLYKVAENIEHVFYGTNGPIYHVRFKCLFNVFGRHPPTALVRLQIIHEYSWNGESIRSTCDVRSVLDAPFAVKAAVHQHLTIFHLSIIVLKDQRHRWPNAEHTQVRIGWAGRACSATSANWLCKCRHQLMKNRIKWH